MTPLIAMLRHGLAPSCRMMLDSVWEPSDAALSRGPEPARRSCARPLVAGAADE
jgi:hypothetical protein